VALFNEKFKDAAVLELERFQAHATEVGEEELEKEFENNVEYLTLMVVWSNDSELLPALLDNFKEITEREISAYEQIINSNIAKDWNATKSKIETGQHTRNREIIQEIVENTKLFQEENAKKFQTWRELDEDGQ
jgi:hypothetical protein